MTMGDGDGGCKQQKWGIGRWVPKGKGYGPRVGIHMIMMGTRVSSHMSSSQRFGDVFKYQVFIMFFFLIRLDPMFSMWSI